MLCTCHRRVLGSRRTLARTLGTCSAASLGQADMQLHICSVLPSPLLTLASPHPRQQAEMLPKYARKDFIFSLACSPLPPFSSALSWEPIKAKWDSRQVGFRGTYCYILKKHGYLLYCIRRGERMCMFAYILVQFYTTNKAHLKSDIWLFLTTSVVSLRVET